MMLAPSPTLARLGFKGRRLRRILDPGHGGLCLDVGSGAAPWPRADVLLEAHPTEASSERALILDRPLVIASVEALPFKDRAFAYIHSSHVLEHVARPDRALRELMRVAPRGYIEVPTRLHERLWPRPDHLWAVSLEDGRLGFGPLPDPDPQLSSWFSNALLSDRRMQSYYWSRYFHDFVHCLSWRRTIDFSLTGPHPAPDRPPAVDPATLEAGLEAARRRGAGLRARCKRLLGRLAGATRVSLLPLLACPDCLGELSSAPPGLRCSGCERNFPVVAGVPVLYPESTR
jgi:uncharacterized protein YbaR (Trm112 family)/SAM-dependent methyltransferase